MIRMLTGGVFEYSLCALALFMGVGMLCGCAPVFVGGRYAVRAYDRDTGNPVQTKVIVAFYDEFQGLPGEWGSKYWAKAVVGPAGEQGIEHPARSYMNWGTLVFVSPLLFGTRPVRLGICVLAEGYWPSIMNSSTGGSSTGLPESRWPGVFGKGGAENADWGEAIPSACQGVWRVLLFPRTRDYDKDVEINALWGAAHLFTTLDKALSSSKDLPEADKKWAYAQLLGLARAELALAQNPETRTALEGWIKTLQDRMAEGK